MPKQAPPLFILIMMAAGTFLAGQGFAQDDWGDSWEEDQFSKPELHGFIEGATAARIVDNAVQPDDFVLNEARFRLDVSHFSDRADFSFKGDFTSDDLSDEIEIDIRQALLSMRVSRWLDLRFGRQVLTWGTGDLVFLNDLFPKDFVSFFIGRDDEFLKAPSTSLKLTFYTSALNLDLVWTPVFEPDRFITGERLSFFNPSLPGLVGRANMPAPLVSVKPEKDLDGGELAARFFRNIGGNEFALYGYLGYSKQPLAIHPRTGRPAHASLAVYGASYRSALFGGIANVEGAFHHSLDDSDGDDPLLPNSQLRFLVGHERELIANLNLGMQYYLEWQQQYEAQVAASPAPELLAEEFRHTVTARFSHRSQRETLLLSLFVFFATNEGDWHLRPLVTKKWSDAVTLSAGGNLMFGAEETFFGQLEENTNIYLRARYSF